MTLKWHGDKVFKEIEDRTRTRTEMALAYLVTKIQAKISRLNTGDSPSKPGEPPKMVTGELYRSIKYELNRRWLTGKVIADSEHAAPLELGTKDMAARPFLMSTIDEEWNEVLKILQGGS